MENRVVLVTGGASGIGKGMVRMFADRGCQVIIFDVQDDKGETLAKELCDQGKKVVYKHVNLFDIDEIKNAYVWIKEQFGKLDYAMNNAGFGIPAKPLDECTSEEVNKVIGICLIAVTNCMIEDKNNERKWFWAYCQYDIWCWIIRNQRKLSLLCS